MRENKFFPVALSVVICGILFLGIYLFQVCFPVAYNYFINEDSWVEYGTFVSFFTAGLLILWTIRRNPSVRRPGYILLCLGLFFVAMEEISWGQRLLGIRTPSIIAQYNQQSELSFHNASFSPGENYFFYAIFIWAVILPEILYRSKRLKVFFQTVGTPIVPRALYPYFILGIYLKNRNIVIKHDELGELIIGLAFLLFAIETFVKFCRSTDADNSAKRRITGWGLAAVLAVTTIIVLAVPKDLYALRRHMHNSAITQYPHFGMYAQAKKIFEYLLQHEELRNDDTLFHYGLFLKKLNSDEADGIFLEALQEAREHMLKKPDKPAPNILAGRILKELNQTDLAQKEFAVALGKDQARLAEAKLDWQRTDALKSMGEAYIEMGNLKLAREHLQKALEYVDDRWQRRGIEKLLRGLNGID